MKKEVKTWKFSSILALVTAGVLWGGSFVVVKDSLDYITPVWQLALRLLIASVPAMILAVIVRRRWNWMIIKKSILLGLAFSGALILQNIGMKYVSASKAGFLTTTYVAFVPVISIIFLRKKCSTSQLIAAVICMIGAGMLAMQDSLIPQRGDMLMLGCGIMYAVHILTADTFKEEDALLLHLGQILTSTVIAVAVAGIMEPVPKAVPPTCLSGLIYCGILEIFLCFFLQIIGQKHTPVVLAGILLSMESVYSAIFAYFFLHETMNGIMWAGCGLIFIAAVVGGL